jgi:hypothetical protein
MIVSAGEDPPRAVRYERPCRRLPNGEAGDTEGKSIPIFGVCPGPSQRSEGPGELDDNVPFRAGEGST